MAAGLLLALARPAPAQDEDKAARANAKARAEAAQKVYKGLWGAWRRGFGPSPGGDIQELFYRWSVRWLEAEIEASTTKAEQVAAAEGHLKRMRGLEKSARAMLEAKGAVAPFEVSAAEFYRLDAEKRLRAIRKK
jgi:hypothetical protein